MRKLREFKCLRIPMKGEPKWDVRENLFMRQKYLENMKMNNIKKDLVEEEGYQADQPEDYGQALDNIVEPKK